jgi:hypothetical protein
VLFRSPVAGVFTSHFELQLTPPLPTAPPPALALRGVSTPQRADLAVQRRALGEQLVHKQHMHAVRAGHLAATPCDRDCMQPHVPAAATPQV